MDVSSLLNAPDVEDEAEKNAQSTPRLALRNESESSSPTPPASTILSRRDDGASTDKDSVRDPITNTSGTLSPASERATIPVTTRPQHLGLEHEQSDTERPDQALSRRAPSDGEELPLTELRELDLGSASAITDDKKVYPTETGHSQHRFSDSQSSVSSYASSPSWTHSRNSSITTIGDDYFVPTIASEALAEETRLATVQEETSTRFLESHPSPDSRLGATPYPYTSADAQTRNTKGLLRRRQRSDVALNTRGRGAGHPWPSPTASSSRPTTSTRGQAHKRALSAPGPVSKKPPGSIGRKKDPPLPRRLTSTMAGVGERSTRATPVGSKIAALDPYTESLQSVGEVDPHETPSRSTSRVTASPAEPVFSTAPQSGDSSSQPSPYSPTEDSLHRPKAAPQDQPSGNLKCMFTENCDTGAQLRKAISHFFGRNKSCTLKIPPHVWVHYCRKHYQRIRYRNSKDYGLIQIDLVRTQVEMLQDWSRQNQESGQGRYIKDWALALRKREQQRLEELGSSTTEGSSSTPQWVFDSLGGGYTSEQILEMVGRFRSELLDKTLDDIPEVEFLPDIVGGSDEGKDKPPKSRKQNKRKASQSNLRQQVLRSGDNDATESLSWNGPSMVPEQEKRRRLDQNIPFSPHGRSQDLLESFSLPPRLHAGSTHGTGLGEHPRFPPQAGLPQSLHLGRDHTEPAPQRMDPALNSSGDRTTGWPAHGTANQIFEGIHVRPRELTHYHTGLLPNGFRNDPFDKLPPLSGYKLNDVTSPDHYLPPISSPYDQGEGTVRPASNLRTPSSEAPRSSEGAFLDQQQAFTFGRPSAPRIATKNFQRWHGDNSLCSQGFGDPDSTNNQSFAQPPRAAYQSSVSSQIPQIRHHGHGHRGDIDYEIVQTDQQYHSSTLPRHGTQGDDPGFSKPSPSQNSISPAAAVWDVGNPHSPGYERSAPGYASDSVVVSGAGRDFSASSGRHISPFTFRQSVDSIRQQHQGSSDVRVRGNISAVSSNRLGATSRYSQTGQAGSEREEREQAGSLKSHAAGPNPGAAITAPIASIRSNSSGSRGSTPRAGSGY